MCSRVAGGRRMSPALRPTDAPIKSLLLSWWNKRLLDCVYFPLHLRSHEERSNREGETFGCPRRRRRGRRSCLHAALRTAYRTWTVAPPGYSGLSGRAAPSARRSGINYRRPAAAFDAAYYEMRHDRIDQSAPKRVGISLRRIIRQYSSLHCRVYRSKSSSPSHTSRQRRQQHQSAALTAAARSLRVILFIRARTRYRYFFLKTTCVASAHEHRGQRWP
ncbi:hypothetical protein EVAR_44347_1 [Eumeta japonica]|uniref:Uncharacterized protein n=1 Tax=Eumeta variegata TaxID=151549 RepID=A0A4C1XA41_EUMVA|nr:hypothetical protein EVAR_44347_1 [Eumeta japonica]